ncbi:serine hydrolase domain-containing protein [Microbacterium sp. SS28]|uniref:serine hydrolase domain-containing protein n=1 Tax=Microbacterium sp. SS28 TaxID=2919948 RepID=UPI001FA9F9D5|nr:serine hydrolase domain-containing protein [Microbacterium sp. SS28]
MTTEARLLHGTADDRLGEIADRLEGFLAADPDLSFQAAAFHDGAPVLDVWGGPHLAEDSVMVPFSVTKNTIGLSVGLLVERGELDLDALVVDCWPEFGAHGKDRVTVRQLLSHQAGLPQATPALTVAELLDDHAAAERLAATTPFWYPGTAFGYHGITIGNLASELVFRVTGRTLHEFYEQEIRAPHGIDFYLGLPADQDARKARTLPMIKPVADTSTMYASLLAPLAFGMPGPQVDLANDEVSWRFGHPAVSGTGTARGLARLFAAAVTGVDGAAPFLSAETVLTIGQQQVRGYDEVLGQPHRSHSIVFQKPTPTLAFGGPRAFGHDGAMGALACVDPDTGIAFAWTIARGPWPGGADPRALTLASDLGTILSR